MINCKPYVFRAIQISFALLVENALDVLLSSNISSSTSNGQKKAEVLKHKANFVVSCTQGWCWLTRYRLQCYCNKVEKEFWKFGNFVLFAHYFSLSSNLKNFETIYSILFCVFNVIIDVWIFCFCLFFSLFYFHYF